ncbi:conjugal transfer protein MobC [Spirosoma linguale]|uniref:Type IV secretory pathway VirD4 protein-like protein n=1 Tax=Spirosoma linguale (strain ATCC 33905 / DSM 74 / LMG 10896 / Claus 1) TaxID=504472 RepID=D2QV24_SPILD|nr:Type IV secretory pathway VirD4 protein-like protein [Spirosoma linguale DSM 74]
MGTQDKEYRGILNMLLFMSLALIGFHLYFFCYDTLQSIGFSFALLDRFILSIDRATHLFSHPVYSKIAALLLLGIWTFGNKTRKQLNVTWAHVARAGIVGGALLLMNGELLRVFWLSAETRNGAYLMATLIGYLLLIKAGSYANQILSVQIGEDAFNDENESFEQETGLKQNEYSVNIPTEYNVKKRIRKGWVNVVNPFRATLVMGTPGSGKSFAVVNNFIRQHLEKGFTMYIYDYKFPDLSNIAYHYLQKNRRAFKRMPTFYVINFDDPRRSNRCNPLLPELMSDIIDAQEAARTILLNLNKSWIQKQGDFFVESPMNFLTAVVWYLKKYDERRLRGLAQQGLPDDGQRYCTFPHVIEFAGAEYRELFPILQSEPEIENLLKPFASALRNEAYEQLEGQIASARIPLSRLSSPALYWVMTGNDFSLDINNPDDPKVLCVGNNPERQEVYGAALGLFNARLIKLVNKKGRLKSSLIIDELPTIYFRGLDNLIATARSNKVSTCLGLQDLSQLKRDYGDKEATTIFNTIGNVFSGQVLGETAKTMSSRFGKNKQVRHSLSFTERDTNLSISENLDSVIPESKISNLSQGHFVGAVADNFDEVIKQKIFHARLLVEPAMIAELERVKPIPPGTEFAQISDHQLSYMLEANYNGVKKDISVLIQAEIERLTNDPALKHLVENLQPKNE